MPDSLGPLREPDEDPGASRQRALWAMAVLACLALIAGASMLLFGGGSGKPSGPIDLLPPVRTPAPTVTGSASPSPARTPSRAASGSSRSAEPSVGTSPTGPPRSGNPCSGAATCVVPGDGGVLAAANAFRVAHGLGPVTGGVTRNAQLCAERRGTGSTCVPHYAWTAMPDQDGAAAITRILQFGRTWLLDRSMTTLDVGWAYTGGQYQCVLLKSP